MFNKIIYYFDYFITFAFHAEVAQLVEHWLPKPRVAGSNPVFRSNRNVEF